MRRQLNIMQTSEARGFFEAERRTEGRERKLADIIITHTRDLQV